MTEAVQVIEVSVVKMTSRILEVIRLAMSGAS